MTHPFPCVCCGHLTLDEPPGSYDICPVCFWEDDLMQLRWPTRTGGPNGPCLIDAQVNYQRVGACEARLTEHVRMASGDEPVEPGWTAIDRADPRFERPGGQSAKWPSDPTFLYWWRPTFWRNHVGT